MQKMTNKRDNQAKKELIKLVGWDDGNIYFYDEDGNEHCVNDCLEVFEQVVKICNKYFKRKGKKCVN